MTLQNKIGISRSFPAKMAEGEMRLALTPGQPLRLFAQAFGRRQSVPFIEALPLSAGTQNPITGTLKLRGSNKLMFRDTSLVIYSGTDGVINFDADVGLNFDSNTLYVDTANNRVGIGTASPNGLLDISKISSGSITDPSATHNIFGDTDFSTREAPIAIYDNVGAYNSLGIGGGILFGGRYTSASGYELGAGIKAERESTTTSDDSWGLGFYTSSDNSLLNARMRIDKDGNVGIGLTGPLAKLHIDQSSTSGAIPVLTLDQADTSEGLINFIASDRGVITGATDSAVSVRVELAGTIYRLALYADA